MFVYPYGNNSNLNLDWLISAWRSFQKDVCSMIAQDYDNTATYPAGSVVIYNMILYTNPEDILTAEEFNPEHWSKTTITELIGGV